MACALYAWFATRFGGRPAATVSICDDRSCFSAGAATPVCLSPWHAYQDRQDSVLGRSIAVPLGESPRPGSGRRGDAGGALAATEAAVPPQSREHLPARRS